MSRKSGNRFSEKIMLPAKRAIAQSESHPRGRGLDPRRTKNKIRED
jgi:hypothetical protein